MTKTKDQILEEMREAMPFHLPERIRPYIEEAMEIYANQQLHQCNVVRQSEQLNAFVDFYNNRKLSHERINYDEIEIFLESI